MARAEVVQVPTLDEWEAMPLVEQRRIEGSLGRHVPERIQAGLLTPGESIDLDDPINAFVVQFRRWFYKLEEGETLRSGLHYPEVIEWNKLRKRWGALKRWRQRYKQ